jgi:GT2 family glycosyltransferase
MEPLVSIVISNFNDRTNLKECLSSLRNLRYPNHETIVVDCGSSDGSIEMVSSEFPEVKLIKTKKMGLAEALNIGISHAKGDLFLLELNSDDVVHPNFLRELVNVLLSSKEIGLVCGKRLVYGTSVIDSAGGKVNMLTGIAWSLGSGKSDSRKFDRLQEVDYAGVYLVKKEVLRTIGVFDPVYYIYFEDTDFCFRAKMLGFKMLYVPSAVLWHKGSSTMGFRSIRYHYFMRRNNYRFVLKNFPYRFLLTALIFQFLLSICLILFFATRSRIDLIASEIGAIRWNLSNLKSTLGVRKSKHF